MSSTYQKFVLSEKLTSQQKAFYEQHGFIHFKNFIHQDTVQSIVNASLEVQKDLLKREVKKVNGVPLKFGTDLDGQTIIQRFAFMNKQHPLFSELIQDPRINALFELIGSGARIGENEKDGMVFNHYVNGPQSKFSQMGWHVDGLRDIFYGTKLNPLLNVGIHLNTLSEKNGGLRVIPGTHRQSIYQLLFKKKHFIDNKSDKDEVAIIPEAGDLTVHDGRLWHRVAKSTVAGEESRRRVIYIPLIAGKFIPKDENSPTLLYQRLANVVQN